MSEQPQLWVLTGGNGAGKSTFYNNFLKQKGMPFINADLIAKELYGDDAEKRSLDAAKVAEQMRYKLVQDGQPFSFETVFSHPSKIDFLGHAKAFGYEIILVYIYLELHDLHFARVEQRVDNDGHTVPQEKIVPRIIRLEKNIETVIDLGLVDYLKILDNSSSTKPFKPVLTIRHGKIDVQTDATPLWASKFIKAASTGT